MIDYGEDKDPGKILTILDSSIGLNFSLYLGFIESIEYIWDLTIYPYINVMIII